LLKDGGDLSKIGRLLCRILLSYFQDASITDLFVLTQNSDHSPPRIVTGRSGSLGSVLYIDEDFWPLNTTLWVKEFRRVNPFYAFYLLSDFDLAQYNSGAAVPTLNRNDIHGLPVILPSLDILSKFEDLLKPLFKLKKNLLTRNENLKTTRDLLLPKLISGEIDVESLDMDKEAIAA
jgi:type I restriction enzyme, S subunit